MAGLFGRVVDAAGKEVGVGGVFADQHQEGPVKADLGQSSGLHGFLKLHLHGRGGGGRMAQHALPSCLEDQQVVVGSRSHPQ